MADITKAVLIFLFVVGGVRCGFIPPDVESGYNGNDPNLAAIYQRLAILENTVNNLQTKNNKLEEENIAIRRILHNECGCKKESTMTSSQDIFDAEKVTRTADENVNKNNAVKKRLLMEGTTNRAVAFRASLSKALPSVGVHQAIEYDNVKLNIGNAYDARHGHLIAPVKGLYLVAANAFSNPGKRVVLDMVHNGNTIAVLDTGLHNSHSSESKTLPILLEQGDMVWVRTYGGFQGEQVPGYADSFHSYFAAVLLVEQ